MPLTQRGREMLNSISFQRAEIQALQDRELFAILRSTNPLSERFANELTWAKAELRRRRLLPDNAP